MNIINNPKERLHVATAENVNTNLETAIQGLSYILTTLHRSYSADKIIADLKKINLAPAGQVDENDLDCSSDLSDMEKRNHVAITKQNEEATQELLCKITAVNHILIDCLKNGKMIGHCSVKKNVDRTIKEAVQRTRD